MPKKSTTYGAKLSWPEGAILFGEETLRAASKTPQGAHNWKTRGIPHHKTVELLRALPEESRAPSRLAVAAETPRIYEVSRPPKSAKERRIGTELAWRLILLERNSPKRFAAVVELIRALRDLGPEERATLKRLDFLILKGGTDR